MTLLFSNRGGPCSAPVFTGSGNARATLFQSKKGNREMPLPSLSKTIAGSKYPLLNTLAMFIAITAFVAPGLVLGQDVGDTNQKVCGFFQNINSLLNAASIVVVTIAVIFSGYQIAFAHKRIADVAPALIGGVLIGAAAQVAKMVVGGNGGATDACKSTSGAMLMDSVHSAMHILQHYA